MIKNSIDELIGNTPILKYKSINGCQIYIKLEMFNVGGSIKDRVALNIINELEKEKKLTKDSVLVEATSGNTGIGLALVAASRGYPLYIYMPENMSQERIRLMKAYGAKVILTPKALGMKGSIEEAKKLCKKDNYIFVNQFHNKYNYLAHQKTAEEINYDLPSLDYVVLGIGTGGTLKGIHDFLKPLNPKVEIIGVEPLESPVLKGGNPGPHQIEGIGANFIPEFYDKSYVSSIYDIASQDALELMRDEAHKGLFVGVSTAANLVCAIKLAESLSEPKSILVISPDGGSKYLSKEIFNE